MPARKKRKNSNPISPDKLLSPIEMAFVIEYCKPNAENAKAAAIAAGYAETTANQASQWIRPSSMHYKPNVAKAIDKRRRRMTDAAGMDDVWVLSKLKQIIEASGNPKDDLYQPGAANQSLQLVARHRGMLKDSSSAPGSIVLVWGGPTEVTIQAAADRPAGEIEAQTSSHSLPTPPSQPLIEIPVASSEPMAK